MKKFILLTVSLFAFVTASAQIQKETYTYAIKGVDTLRMDRYFRNETVKESRPAIIFMFGGGFFTGMRDAQIYQSFFEYYANRGYVVLSIDYRLGLKGGNLKQINGVKQLVETIDHTITIAVEDLFDATNYVLKRTTEWGIDSSLVVTAGSSAGAISVLQAQYNIANGTELSKRLPVGFRYAGTIGFAGAIFNSHGKLKWGRAPSPLLLFHGEADSNVPYSKMTIFGKGFYGSQRIVRDMRKIKSPYYFCSFINADHRIASAPMNDNRYDIDAFLDEMVRRGQQLMVDKEVQDLKLPKVTKNFNIKDYLNANFKPRKKE